jgi:hypothetical protein
MEIAYNIFLSTSVPFLQKAKQGMENAKIHHNTIIGADTFIIIDHPNSDSTLEITWKPTIYNNLIIFPKEKVSIITELSQHVSTTRQTSFTKGSMFYNNVWLASDFSGGTALEQDYYKLQAESPDVAGLYIDENIEISVVPEFLETTDIYSENYYSLNSTRFPWVLGENFSYGTEPAYVGAVKPIAIQAEPGEYFSIDGFKIISGDYNPLSELTFEIEYSQNVGDVILSLDFDGDGSFDYVGSDTSVKYTYPTVGDFIPVVKAVDSATGKEISASLAVEVLKICRKQTYVDALANDGGDGSIEKPYNSLEESITYAAEDGIIYVRGGDDRTYEINSASDLIVVDKAGLTICSWGDFGKPKFVISHLLSEEVANPNIITITEESKKVTISDLDFVWYGKLNEAYPGDSIGTSGRVILTFAENTMVKNCNFRVEGASSKEHNAFAIASAIEDTYTIPGEFLQVMGCIFEGLTGEKVQMNAIRCGKNADVIQNVFTNCYRSFTFVKNGGSQHLGVISNALYECATINTIYGNWAETPNVDIAYNKFVTSKGVPFITKQNHGLNEDVYIHHNTIIGSSTFLNVITSGNTLRPQIYDNLILLASDGIIIKDDSSKLPSNYTSAILNETSFNNNVYIANSFFGGSALDLAGYNCALTPVDCVELDAAPRFMSTEMGNTDEYRIRATKLDWAFTSSVGGYPNYVGAVEPFLAPLSTTIIIR